MHINTRRDREKAKYHHPQKSSVAFSSRPYRWALYALGLVGLALLGTLFQDAMYGQLLIIGYGVVAIIFKVNSNESFKMAIISFICIILLVLAQNDEVAKNFATYAFLLIIVGILSAIFETKTERKEEA
ncbi:MAG TPA: hypothetical protein VD907_03200 [Verrucomicrobiae bacterium]|nr:hypothetical protein [Verrucomicrobiae bacterium]